MWSAEAGGKRACSSSYAHGRSFFALRCGRFGGLSRLCVCLGAVVSLAACATPVTKTGLPTMPLADFASAYVDQYCASALQCPDAHLWFSYATLDGCKALMALAVVNPLVDLVPGVDTGVVRYDGTAAQTCLDALKDCSVFGIDGKPAACLALFTGTIGDGGTCALDAACVSGLCDQSQGCGACATRSGGGGACTINRDCEVGLSCVAGLCDLRPEPPLGVSCLDSFECGPQAFCPTPVADPTTWHCQARGGAGDPCVWEGSCLTGLRCTGKAPKWVCAVSPGAGDACIDSFSDDDCAPNLACVTDQNGASTCQPRVGLGAPCSQSGMCQGQDLRCADGSCALLGGKGATCFGVAESGKLECFPGLDCVGHVCVDMPVAGQPCDFRCDNATCVENVCVALASEGQACGDGCLNGLVCDDATGAALCTVCH